jgi:hypothetical protein
MTDLTLIAQALRNAKTDNDFDRRLLHKMATHFQAQANLQCGCGACPGGSIGTEWAWLFR